MSQETLTHAQESRRIAEEVLASSEVIEIKRRITEKTLSVIRRAASQGLTSIYCPAMDAAAEITKGGETDRRYEFLSSGLEATEIYTRLADIYGYEIEIGEVTLVSW